MRRIAGSHAARLFLAVEGEGVAAEVFTPERRFEPLPKSFGLGDEIVGPLILAEPPRAFRGGEESSVDIALNLNKRDRSFGKFAIGVENCVV